MANSNLRKGNMKHFTPVATIGSSIAILFALCTIMVLACIKNRPRTLSIKQHYALCIIIVNLIVLLGMKKLDKMASCVLVSILLQYGVTVLFTWMFLECFHLYQLATKRSKILSFVKLFLLGWGVPVLFVAIGVGIGVSQKMESSLHECWKTDRVIWIVAAPCFLLILATLVLMITIPLKIARETKETKNADHDMRNTSESNKKLNSQHQHPETIRYIVLTNSIQLLLLIITWISGYCIFWYPKHEILNLVFGLGNAVQGMLLFFFYCVFYVGGYLQQTSGKQICEEVGLIQEETDEVGKSLEDFTKRDIPETAAKITPVSEPTVLPPVESTSVLVHTSSKIKTEEKQKQATCTGDEDKGETKKEDENEIDGKHTEGNEVKDLSDEHVQIAVITEGSHESLEHLVIQNHLHEIKDGEKSPTYSAPPTEKKMNENSKTFRYQPESTESENTPPMKKSQTRNSSDVSNNEIRDNRTSSRISTCSFNSQMGMNELESLFNNPDLLNQSTRQQNKTQIQSPVLNSKEEKKIRSNEKKDSQVKSDEGRVKKQSRNEFFDFG